MSRRGYAEQAATEQLHAVILATVGEELGGNVQVGRLRQGVLQLFAPDSVSLQELNFQKRSILRSIQRDLPDAGVNDVRFRIQS